MRRKRFRKQVCTATLVTLRSSIKMPMCSSFCVVAFFIFPTFSDQIVAAPFSQAFAVDENVKALENIVDSKTSCCQSFQQGNSPCQVDYKQ